MPSASQQILAALESNSDTLVLDEQNLSELPPEIGLLTDLEVLSLATNQLTRLPADIGQLAKLKELCVSENRLVELPPQIGQLVNLEILWLNDNVLGGLPAEIRQLGKLRNLHLQENRLTELPPEIGKLANLQRLWIQNNRLTQLPAELCQLERLKDWDFTKKSLPPRFPWALMAQGNPLVHPPPEVLRKGTRAVQDYLRAAVAIVYTVYVDDNYHPMDQSERYKLGDFPSCESAAAACKKIVDEFLAGNSKGTAKELLDAYKQFGEDPWISSTDKDCVFSAWKYAEQRCQEIEDS